LSQIAKLLLVPAVAADEATSNRKDPKSDGDKRLDNRQQGSYEGTTLKLIAIGELGL